MSLPQILPQQKYVDDLIMQINNPETTSAWVQAMVFSPRNTELKLLMEALHGLLQRGGTATIITDYYNYLRPEDHKLSHHRHDEFYVQEVHTILTSYQAVKKEFTEAGGTWVETNKYSFFSTFVDIWNRNHMKSAGVMHRDGSAYTYLGGCNLYPHAMEFIDFMVRFNQIEIYEKVKHIVKAVIAGTYIQDVCVPCTKDYTLYIDGGHIPGRSIIMRKTFELIKEKGVKNIYLTSQLPMDPLIQGVLKSLAKKDVTIDIFIPPPAVTDVLNEGVGKWLYERMVVAEKKYAGYRIHRSKERKVHAKLLLTENVSGEYKAFFGSNNYFMLGPILNTSEIQILSVQQELNHLLKDTFWGLVSGATDAAPFA